MVGEAQVDAAAVDVERIAEVAPGHRRALQVPARSAGAEVGRPLGAVRLAGLVTLPEGEVAGIVLAARVGVLGRGHVIQRLPGQRAVFRPGFDVEVDVAAAVGGGIRMALLDQRVHELDHLQDVPGRARLVGRREDAEQVERFAGGALVAVRPRPPLLARLGRLGEDLVIDVGDVAHERDIQTVPDGEPAAQHVERHREAHVADVGGALGREPTDVDPDLAVLQGAELAHGAGGGVEQVQAHPGKFRGYAVRPLPNATRTAAGASGSGRGGSEMEERTWRRGGSPCPSTR